MIDLAFVLFSFTNWRSAMCSRNSRITVLVAVVGLVLGTVLWARGDSVLPATATPDGHSLSNMAAITAAYNEAGGTPPNVPFDIIVGNATVDSSTTLYVPIFYADNGPPPTIPPFPTDISDEHANAQYLYSQAGVTGFILQLDGVTTSLSDDYVSAVPVSPPLPDTANNYIVSAAFLSPLSVGQHTLGIGGIVNGQPQVFFSDTINSVPEPAGVALAIVGLLSITALYSIGSETLNRS
jgi:hypothetical protein